MDSSKEFIAGCLQKDQSTVSGPFGFVITNRISENIRFFINNLQVPEITRKCIRTYGNSDSFYFFYQDSSNDVTLNRFFILTVRFANVFSDPTIITPKYFLI